MAKSLSCAPLHSLIAQPVERRTVNPQVPGSNPGRGATFLQPEAIAFNARLQVTNTVLE